MKLDIVQDLTKRDTLLLLVNDKPWKRLHTAIFGRKPRFNLKIQTKDELIHHFGKWELEKARNYAIRRLTQQSYHSEKLKNLLVQRLIPLDIAEKVIQECIERGFLQDDLWLDHYIKRNLKKMSKRVIFQKLKREGIPLEILKELEEQWQDPQEEIEALKNLIQLRMKKKEMSDFKTRQKLIAYLARKGFSFDNIKEAISCFSHT